MPNPAPSLVRGSALMLFSMILAGGFAVLISIVIARRLGTTDFGVYAILISVQGVVLLLASFGLGTAIAKYVSEYRIRGVEQALRFAKSALIVVLILASLISLIYSTLGELIGMGLYNEAAIIDVVPFSALMVFSSSVFSASMGIVQGCQKFRMMAGAQIATSLFSLILILVLLPLMGMKGIFAGYFVSQLAVSAVLLVILNKSEFRFLRARLELHRGSPVVSMVVSFALPAVLASLLVVPVVWVANTELTLVTGFEAMGYFAVALFVYQSLILMPNALAIPMMPMISQLAVEDHENLQKLIAKVMKTLSVSLFPVLFAVALFSDIIVEILYGSGFSASAEAVYLMVIAAYFYSLAAVLGTIITGTGRMWLGLLLTASWAATFLFFVFVGVPEFGANGLAIAYAASYGLFLIMMLMASRRVLRVRMTGIYLAGTSSSFFFLVGFLLQDQEFSYELSAKIALFAGGVACFYLIGRDVFRAMYLKVRTALPGVRI